MMADLLLVQPLYAPHVRVAKGMYKNIVIIATEFNSVYGFDAGAPKSSMFSLSVSLLLPMPTCVDLT